jgi:two-component system LytT family sensor kinase
MSGKVNAGVGSIDSRSRTDQSTGCIRPAIHCNPEPILRSREYDYLVNEAPTNSRPNPKLWIALIWLGVGLIDASQTVFPMRAQGMHHNWVRLFVTLVIDWLPWALATPLVMRVGRRYPPFRSPTLKAVSAHVGLVGIISLLTAAWSAVLEVLLDPWGQAQPVDSYVSLWLAKLSYGLLASLVLYAFIQAITFAIDSAENTASQRTESARLSEQLAKAQLNGLRQQMNPHFMFNTLNAISGLIRDRKNDAAVSMIAGLSDLLRRAAYDADRPRVALREEIDSLHKFLDIQRTRFSDRLRVVIDIPSDLYPVRVPNLLLQPLVENAIKHGIAKRIEGGRIEVTGCRSEGLLKLRVYNDGPRLHTNWEAASGGIGLANLRARLQILYGSNFELDLSSPEAGGVAVAVSLPLDVRE